MSNPAFATNGSSLENCHTNVFALTELNGLQWKRFVSPLHANGNHFDHLHDPILTSYGSCVSANLLAAWKRVSLPSNPNQKKLWVFWYGEEPELHQILSPGLVEEESGGWDNGLLYECRILLFRALHTLIERCLLAHKYVRLGRWFVEPHDAVTCRSSTEKLLRYSYAFDFFLHGENTVCTTVDVRLHPQLLRLNKSHILHSAHQSATNTKLPVILCPYGLSGVLTGKVENPERSKELLQEWKLFFPLIVPAAARSNWRENHATPGPSPHDASASSPAPDTPNVSDGNVSASPEKVAEQVPHFVEVIVANTRMIYPSMFVMVVDDHKLSQLINQHNSSHPNGSTATPLVPETSAAPSQVTLQSDRLVKQYKKQTRQCLSRRNGLNGVPDIKDEHDMTRVKKSFHALLKDISGSKRKGASQDKSRRTVELTAASRTTELHTSVFSPEISDSAHRRQCDCETCRSHVEVATARSNSPISNHGSYATQGLSILAMNMKAKVAQELPKLQNVQVTSQPSRLQQLPSFHKRNLNPSVCEKDAVILTSSTPVSAPSLPEQLGSAENNASLRAPPLPSSTRHNAFPRGSTLSPAASYYPKTPATPQSQLGSVVQMSPVSSPASMCSNSVPSPVTPFNPRTPRTPRSTGPRSVYNTMDREPLAPSTPLRPQSQGPLSASDPLNGSSSQERFLPSSDLSAQLSFPTSTTVPVKRPYLEAMFDGEDDENEGIALSARSAQDTGSVDWEMVDVKRQKISYPLPIITEALAAPFNSDPSFQSDKTLPANLSDACVFPEVQVPETPVPDVKFEKRDEPPRNFPGTVGPMELSRMFPTPPSMESQPTCSPMDVHQCELITLGDNDNTIITPMEPTKSTRIVSGQILLSSKYSALKETPSSSLQPVLRPVVDKILYRPSWLITSQFQYGTPPTPRRSLIRMPGSIRHPVQLQSHPSSLRVSLMGNNKLSPRSGVFSPGVDARFGAVMRPPPYPPQTQNPLLAGMMMGRFRGMEMPGNVLPLQQQHNHNPPGPPQQHLFPALPECHALLVNLLIGDSLMNLFPDNNFVGCSICVCNMSIRSSDYPAVHLPLGQHPASQHVADEHQFRCICGFNSVVNRRFSCMAGLFLEDELEVTGVASTELGRRNGRANLSRVLDLPLISPEQDSVLNRIPDFLISLVKYQASNPFLSCSTVHQSAQNVNQAVSLFSGSDLQLEEMDRFCNSVILFCQPAPEMAPLQNMLNAQQRGRDSHTLHSWIGDGRVLDNHAELIRVQQIVQPFLQEAVQLRRQTRLWDKVFTVEGPLTWKDFLRFADKDVMEGQKEPLPIPSWMVGLDKDWLHISPTAFTHWEKLAVEPLDKKRDVVYVVLAPENDYLYQGVKTFFRDLTKSYEMCGLGRHVAIPRLMDGVMEVKSGRAHDDNLDEWFRCIGDSPVASKLRLYASTCRSTLGPHIASQESQGNIANIFLPPPPPPLRPLPEGSSSTTVGTDGVPSLPTPSSSSSLPCPTPSSYLPTSDAAHPSGHVYGGTAPSNHILSMALPTYPFDPGCHEKDEPHPLIVVYVVDPFMFGPKREGLYRLTCAGLLRSYQELLKVLPENLRDHVVLQMVPVQNILEHSLTPSLSRRSDLLRSLALSVYSQNLRRLSPKMPSKMLTGFGPATAFKRWLEDGKRSSQSVFAPPYILSPRKEKPVNVEQEAKEKSQTLLFAYCLSEDQRWLLVSYTDERGEMLETQIISISVESRLQRKGASVIRFGLHKLWEFVLGAVSRLTGPCRLVIGRIGRLGHGELRGWSCILSKKALSRSSQQLRQMCLQCNCKLMGNQDLSNIVSACLISLQPESSLRVAADAYSHDERVPSAATLCPLSTPEEVSCTHLYVFPTSATAQARSLSDAHAGEHLDIGGDDGDLDFINLNTDEFNGEVGDQVVDGIDFSDFFMADNALTSPATSPKPDGLHSRPLSPSQQNRMKTYDTGIGFKTQESCMEEPGQLLQQPLAIGYLISTARTGPMPSWFFSATDQDPDSCPIVLRTALHIHSANVLQGDDMYHGSSNSRNGHPLDSNLTADVLKHVLECYNALSWLVIDPGSLDRRSCLPQHVQVLMQLYFAAAAIL